MNQKLYVVSVFIFLNTTFWANAQFAPFPLDSTIWTYHTEPNWFYFDYTITRDTTLNNTSYKRVFGNGKDFIYRVDSNRVWARLLNQIVNCPDTNEFLIYDFSLSIDDSVTLHTCDGDSFLCVVKVIDSVLTNVGYRKEIKIPNSNRLTCFASDTLVWIEGIGSSNDLFYLISFFFPGTVCNDLFYFNNINSYGQNIFIVTNSLVIEKRNNIYIDKNLLIHSNREIDIVNIYDLMGKLISTSFPDSYLYQIDSNDLSPGMNIISIVSKNNYYSFKLINSY